MCLLERQKSQKYFFRTQPDFGVLRHKCYIQVHHQLGLYQIFFVSIGCSSTFLKQLYCQFLIIIIDLVSGKKETVESQLYLNYFVSVVILEVYILH